MSPRKILLVLSVLLLGTVAFGWEAIRSGPGGTAMARGDHGATEPTDLGFQLNALGGTWSRISVNLDGYVTLDGAYDGQVEPATPLSERGRAILAPFYADVDTTDTLGSVRHGSSTVDGRSAYAVTWSDVAFYGAASDADLNTFQLIIIDRSDTGAGNFDLEFNYGRIAWESGSGRSSGGSGGLGGNSARVGYANGECRASYELSGSGVSGSFLDDNATNGLVHGSLNSTVSGRYVFHARGGVLDTTLGGPGSRPTVTTGAVTVGAASATVEGSITNLGSSDVTAHGHVWSTSAAPTLADAHSSEGATAACGSFTSSLTDLDPTAEYHVRAYAMNRAGIAYGEEKTIAFAAPPVVDAVEPVDGAATGDEIVITGEHLGGATSVTFGGVEAYAFEVVESTRIVAVLGGGASGTVEVTTPEGVAGYEGFLAEPPGDIHIDANAGERHDVLPADHPILDDGRIEPTEYAGYLVLDPSAGGTFAGLADGPLSLHANGAVHVHDRLDVTEFGGGRDVTVRAEREIRIEHDGGIASAGGTITLVVSEWLDAMPGPESVTLDPGAGRVTVYARHPHAVMPHVFEGLHVREVFGVEYPDAPVRDGNVVYYAASLVEGHVFVDGDRNLARGAGEEGLAGIEVTAGPRKTRTDPRGRYRFVDLPAGAHTIAVTRPAGHVAVAGDERTVVLEELGVATETDVAYFAGARVDGHVFHDDGAGGGTPHDLVRGDGEAGAGGVEVTAVYDGADATAPGGTEATVTDASGSYALFVPADAGRVYLSHDAPGAPVGASDGSTIREGRLVDFGAVAGEAFRHDFGIVRRSRLSADQEGQVASPGSRDVLFRYEPGTQGTLRVGIDHGLSGHRTIGAGLFGYSVDLDGTCIGGTGWIPLAPGAPVAVDDAWPREGGRLAACPIRVRVTVPSGASPSASEAVVLNATLERGDLLGSDVVDASLTTEVAGEGRLELTKRGRLVTGNDAGDGWADRLEGGPGDVIEYEVAYRNVGTAPVFEIDLRVEGGTAAEVLAEGPVVLVCPDGTDRMLHPTGSGASLHLADHCRLPRAEHPDPEIGPVPALEPGESGTLTYRVRIE